MRLKGVHGNVKIYRYEPKKGMQIYDYDSDEYAKEIEEKNKTTNSIV